MAKKQKPDQPPARKQVEIEIDCDTGLLYGDIAIAARYFAEMAALHPNATLDEHWTGYEEMHMRFVEYRLENDDEFQLRLDQERAAAQRAEAERKREALRAVRRKEWEKLNREFGR